MVYLPSLPYTASAEEQEWFIVHDFIYMVKLPVDFDIESWTKVKMDYNGRRAVFFFISRITG